MLVAVLAPSSHVLNGMTDVQFLQNQMFKCTTCMISFYCRPLIFRWSWTSQFISTALFISHNNGPVRRWGYEGTNEHYTNDLHFSEYCFLMEDFARDLNDRQLIINNSVVRDSAKEIFSTEYKKRARCSFSVFLQDMLEMSILQSFRRDRITYNPKSLHYILVEARMYIYAWLNER